MKNRVIILFTVLFSLPCALHAQWGVKVGTGLSSMDGSENSMVSAQVGGTYDLRLSRRWFLEPELQLVYFGYSSKDNGFSVKSGKVRFFALELPVNLSLRPKISETMNLLVGGGLYFRYSLAGNEKYKYYDASLDTDKSPFDDFNRFDMGTQFQVGLQVKRFYGIFSFQHGLSHAYRDGSFHYRNIRLSAGYRF
ncbi:MAG: PorT family protein [Mediterranea sp.]|jgi:outer membrane autotransporter protein|nr:PorT family protein [Mediterranea sp.]